MSQLGPEIEFLYIVEECYDTAFVSVLLKFLCNDSEQAAVNEYEVIAGSHLNYLFDPSRSNAEEIAEREPESTFDVFRESALMVLVMNVVCGHILLTQQPGQNSPVLLRSLLAALKDVGSLLVSYEQQLFHSGESLSLSVLSISLTLTS